MVIAEGGGNPEMAMSFRKYEGSLGGRSASSKRRKPGPNEERKGHACIREPPWPSPAAEMKLHTSSSSLALHHCNNYTRDAT